MTTWRTKAELDWNRLPPATAAEKIQYDSTGGIREYANYAPMLLRAYWEAEHTPPSSAFVVTVCFVHHCERCSDPNKEAFPYPAGWLCNDCFEAS